MRVALIETEARKNPGYEQNEGQYGVYRHGEGKVHFRKNAASMLHISEKH